MKVISMSFMADDAAGVNDTLPENDRMTMLCGGISRIKLIGRYVKAGFKIFQLAPGSKKPLAGVSWALAATDDMRTIARWLRNDPWCNLGATAGDGGIFIDADTYKESGDGFDRAAFEALDLPPTLKARTPGGGFHYALGGAPVGSRNNWRKGIDVKSAGGYVVLPGSYFADRDHNPAKDERPKGYTGFYEIAALADIAPLPDGARDMLPRVNERKQRSSGTSRVKHGSGGRNVQRLAPVAPLDHPLDVAQAHWWLENRAPKAVASVRDSAGRVTGGGGEQTTLDVFHMVREFGCSPRTSFRLVRDHYNVEGKCIPLWSRGGLLEKWRNAWDYQGNPPGSKSHLPAAVEWRRREGLPPDWWPLCPELDAIRNEQLMREFAGSVVLFGLDDPEGVNELLERISAEGPGAAFEPHTLAEMLRVKKDNAPAYQNLLAKLKAALRGSFTDLRAALGEAERERAKGEAEAGAADLYALLDKIDLLFIGEGVGSGAAYADIVVNGVRKTMPVDSEAFRFWLRGKADDEQGSMLTRQWVDAAVATAAARAHNGGERRDVFMRVGQHGGRLYIDLGDASFRAVEITPEGWSVIDRAPIRFNRPGGMTPLPEPIRGGSIEELRPFFIGMNDEQFALAVGWMLCALRPAPAYPLIALTGEPGSAKTTVTQCLQMLADPNSGGVIHAPDDARSLFTMAKHRHAIVFDNLRRLTPDMSDAYCGIATGQSLVQRELFTTTDENILSAVRPMLLNGVNEFVTQSDLASRAFFIHLGVLDDSVRRPPEDVMADFEAARPRIIGAIMDALSAGLRNEVRTTLARWPRMAGAARWMVACEEAFGWSGEMAAALDANAAREVDTIVEQSDVAQAIMQFVDSLPDQQFSGPTRDLYEAMENTPAALPGVGSPQWPKAPNGFSQRLTMLARVIRASGYRVEFDGRSKLGKTVTVERRRDG